MDTANNTTCFIPNSLGVNIIQDPENSEQYDLVGLYAGGTAWLASGTLDAMEAKKSAYQASYYEYENRHGYWNVDDNKWQDVPKPTE